MKKLAKRLLLAMLAASMCMTGVACGTGTGEDDTAGETAAPETAAVETAAAETEEAEIAKTEDDGMKRFEITYFYGPHNEQLIDESFYEKIADAGFTSIPLEYGNTELNKKALPILKKYGLTCSALSDSRIDAVIGYDRTFSPDTPQEEVDRVISEVVADYAEYTDVIEGWLLQDEPCEARFEILGKVVSAFRRFSPGKLTMINLLPCWAGEVNFGTATYREYLDEFVSQVNPHYLSYDNYHFYEGGGYRAEDFFTNLELVRDKAKECGLDPMVIILLTKHHRYADLTFDQIEWEVNTAMTYGMKRISYFTFILEQYLLDDGWDNSCMNYMGEIYPHYYDVQEINRWLLPLGNELFDKESVGVYHLRKFDWDVLEAECEEYTPTGVLGEVKGDRFVIGLFDDGSFMITNKLWDELDGEYNTFEFVDIKDGLEYFDTTDGQWKDAVAEGFVTRNENGNLTREFHLSEGVLFRVK
ncbi:MAG: hypothetical protein E7638_04340 [Ruminococcaceae bacterium]|nr:hypothetical protein [Oscillospiraceae bacterium]